ANRGDYDLRRHQEFSGEKLEYFDQATGRRYVPHVIEPAAGATRAAMAFLMAAYDEEEVAREGQGQGEMRTVLRFHPRIAPYKVAVLPLSKKPELQEPAREVLSLLQPHFMCDYDETQAIGRRYRRQDELGTPFCVTVDFDTLEDRAVTVRDRDSMAQDRVPIAELVDHRHDRLGFWRPAGGSQASPPGRQARGRLRSDRRRFSASRRRRARRDGRVGRRGVTGVAASSISSASRSRARLRLRHCERDSSARTRTTSPRRARTRAAPGP